MSQPHIQPKSQLFFQSQIQSKSQQQSQPQLHITDRLYSRKWGIFNHFLYNSPGSNMDFGPDLTNWNERVEALNVTKTARMLNELGAGYYFITIMQGRKYMVAPNSIFDEIAGVKPGEACAHRDLIADLYDALSVYNIDLYLYFTGDGPYKDEEIGRRFGFINPRKNVATSFVEKWASVLHEYSVRYGDKIKGWWIDGCFSSFGYDDSLMKPYHDAIKAGNPYSVTAFNNGVKPFLAKWYREEEFVCGEFNDFTYIPESRFIDGAQAHILAPLGKGVVGNCGGWGETGVKRDNKYMIDYVKRVNDAGGVVTVDIHINSDGSFDPKQVEALQGINKS